MSRLAALSLAAATVAAVPAFAEFAKVEDQSQFVSLVDGKRLTRPFVSIEVSPDGAISGKGAAWEVTGNWTWREGYFCRDLYWGGDELGYNCQAVHTSDGRIRFTSDKGAGDSAEFSLK